MGASQAFPENRNTIGFPAGHLFGMTLSNNGSDATNDIDFAAGQCRNSTDVKNLIGSAMTKQLDATWAAGTNAGGMMSAAAIANTTYHCYAILKDADNSVDYGFDTSATAPTMPSGYTYFRRIGSVLRLSAALVAFSQLGDEFLLKVPVLDVNTNNPGTSAVLAPLTVPLGIQVEARIWARFQDTTPDAVASAYISSPDVTDNAADSINRQLITIALVTINPNQTGLIPTRTDTSAQVRYRLSVSDTDKTFLIQTHGWRDTRGRLA